MPFRRVITAVLAALAVVLTGVVAAAPASAETVVPLPWISLAQVLADAHGHVYLTGGATKDGVWVRNADGSASTTIANQAGASGMALSADGASLYVALADAAAISVIDTTTLTETARFATAGECPSTVAVVGTALWYSTTCGTTALGTVALSDGTVSHSTQTFSSPTLLSIPGDATTLLVGERGISPTSVYRYSVSGTTLTQTAVNASVGDNMASMALDPDGVHLVVACGWPYLHPKLLLSDLTADGSYVSDTYPNAVATASGLGGVVAAGVYGIYWKDIAIYRAGALVRTVDFPQGDELRANGLAWSPDGTHLYAVSQSTGLHVYVDAAKSPTTLTLAGQTSAAPGAAVALTGSLTDGAAPIVGATVTVSRTDGDGTTNLPDATTTADGSYSVNDTIGTTAATYTASYAGDATRAASQATAQVAVVKNASTLTVVAPTTGTRGVAYTVTGNLSSLASPVVGATVTLKRTDLAGTKTLNVVTNASGAYSYRDVPAVGGPITWVASWVGDATRAPSTASRTVTIARTATALTMKTSASAYAYGGRATVTIHLGTTYNRRDVYVYARPLGPTVGAAPGTLIAHATVNKLGNVVVTYTMRARTTITVRFLGDYRYGAASRAVTPNVVTTVPVQAAGYSSRSGSTYVFRAATAYFRASTRPVRAIGGCIAFQAQQYFRGKWVSAGTLSCAHIQSDYYAYAFTNRQSVGVLYRIRAYVGTGSYSLGGSSAWLQFKFA